MNHEGYYNIHKSEDKLQIIVNLNDCSKIPDKYGRPFKICKISDAKKISLCAT